MTLNSNSKQLIAPKTRDERGASLAAMLTMSVTVGIITTALMTTLVSSYEKIGAMKNGNRVRALAEGGIDYVIKDLCANLSSSTYDSGSSTVGQTTTKTLSSAITNDPKATVSVEVKTVAYPTNTSMLFDPILIQSMNVSNPTNPTNFVYRQVTCTATVGGATKQIRCMLQPIIGVVQNTNQTQTVTYQFPFAAFGVQSIVFAGQSGSTSYNSPDARLYADVGSLGKVSQVYGNGGLSRGIAQGGSHYESPSSKSYYNQQFGLVSQTYNAQPATTAPWMEMFGNVYSNGGNTAYQAFNPTTDNYTTTSSNGMASNVFGSSNGLDTGIPDGNGGTIPIGSPAKWSGGDVNFEATDGYYPQPNIPAAPSAPSGTVDLGSINLQSGATINIQDGAAPVSSIPTMKGGTLNIPPGNYVVHSVSLSGGSKINVSASTPTSLYVQGASGSGNAISVSNDSSINMTGVQNSNGSTTTPPTGMNTSGQNGLVGKDITTTTTTGSGRNKKTTTETDPGNAADPSQLTINNPTATSLTNNVVETSGSAGNLQVYSNSGQTIVLQGSERMVIYAPYSDITVGSTKSGDTINTITNNANYYGSMVAKNVTVQSSYSTGGGAFLHYDYKLKPASVAKYMDPMHPPALMVITNSANTNVAYGVTGYRAVTWQESTRKNVWAGQ